MSEFLYIYRGGDAPGSPEQLQQRMQRWRGWITDLAQNGHLKDSGQPLEDTGKVVGNNQKIITDGPYAEAKDLIGGYTIVEATDIDHAVALTAGCPAFEVGGTVEVRPLITISM